MASHLSVLGALQTLQAQLSLRMEHLLGTTVTVEVLGSNQLQSPPNGQALGLYLHRVALDPFSRNRHLPPAHGSHTPRQELPLNLHLLLVGWSTQTASEISLLAAAMQVIGSALVLDASHMSHVDPHWGETESLQLIPEEMSTEDLMRLWDSLPGDYRLSAPYLLKTLRLAPVQPPSEAPLVRTVVFSRGGR